MGGSIFGTILLFVLIVILGGLLSREVRGPFQETKDPACVRASADNKKTATISNSVRQ